MMSQSTSRYLVVAAPGTTHYHENAPGNIMVCKESTKMVIEAVKFIKLTEKEAFVVCDYGAADGGTSITVIREVIDFIKKNNGSSQEIHVIYEDLPTNNFNSLFEVINSDASYLSEYSNVYISACGTSFYQQCLPSESVHLGISYTAMMNLSKKPCDLSGGPFLHVGTSHTSAEKTMFARQAAKDWETNLLCRSRELKPGGSLVIVTLCIGETGCFTGMRPGVKESMFEVMSFLWKQMVDESIITAEEFHKTTYCLYFMTSDELKSPFIDNNSAVRKAGLKMVQITMKVNECPHAKRWIASGYTPANISAAQAHAKQFVGDIQRWSRSLMLSGLSDGRSNKEQNDIVDEFYRRYECQVAESPTSHCYDYVHAYIHIFKESVYI